MDIAGKLVLVTGASRGIGRATALAFAQAGADVVINYLQNDDDAAQVVKEIDRIGRKAYAIQADIANEHDIRRMRESILAQSGQTIDVLINNAGAILYGGNWLDAPTDLTKKTIDTNLTGMIFCCQIFAPDLIEKKEGAIVNLSSTYGLVGAADVLAYTVAKAGIVNLTQSLARELGVYKITVNAIAPGVIDTDMTKGAGDEFLAEVCKASPVGRLGKPEEIADAAIMLVKNGFINGHVLVVDGGHILNM